MIDTKTRFGDNADGLFIATSQDIPDSFTSWLAEKRRALAAERAGEYLHVASIPVVFVHKWLREGFDIYREPVTEIVKRIKRESLDGFLATEKVIV